MAESSRTHDVTLSEALFAAAPYDAPLDGAMAASASPSSSPSRSRSRSRSPHRGTRPGGYEATTGDEEYERDVVLAELRKLRQSGHDVAREFTKSDNLGIMQREVRRVLQATEDVTRVKFMKDCLNLFCTGIEMGNNRWGPILDIDGWSHEVRCDMPNYDPILRSLHYKYFGQSSEMSPELQLLMGLGASIGSFQVKRMMFGPSSGQVADEQQVQPTVATARPVGASAPEPPAPSPASTTARRHITRPPIDFARPGSQAQPGVEPSLL